MFFSLCTKRYFFNILCATVFRFKVLNTRVYNRIVISTGTNYKGNTYNSGSARLVRLGPLKPTKNNESSPLFNNWKPANTSKLFYSNSFQGLIKAGAKDLETECTIDNICKC